MTEDKLRLRWKRVASVANIPDLGASSAILVGHVVHCTLRRGQAYKFDTKTRTWTKSAQSTVGIVDWHAAEIVDDKIFYFGGRAPVEYDTVLERRRVVETANIGPARTSFMTAVFATSRNEIVTFGGYSSPKNGRTNETHAYNTTTKAWKKLELKGKQPPARNGHAATMCLSKMYIFGGYDENRMRLGDLWIAELGKNLPPTWSKPRTTGITPRQCSRPTWNNLNGRLILAGWSFQCMQVYIAESEMWCDESSSQVDVRGLAPNISDCREGIDIHNGILYFTPKDVYVLSQEEI